MTRIPKAPGQVGANQGRLLVATSILSTPSNVTTYRCSPFGAIARSLAFAIAGTDPIRPSVLRSTFNVPAAPVRIPDAWSGEWYRNLAQVLSEEADRAQGNLDSNLREAIQFPEDLPAVTAAVANGDLWIRLAQLDTLRSEWLALDSVGKVKGRLTAPPGFRLLAADTAGVMGVVKEALDVQSLVRGVLVPDTTRGTS